MTDLAQLEAWRDALLRARYAGLRAVEIEGRRVSYATDAEMATALGDLMPNVFSLVHILSF
jgi:hypothetical protein